jgi:hypothetical protein
MSEGTGSISYNFLTSQQSWVAVSGSRAEQTRFALESTLPSTGVDR